MVSIKQNLVSKDKYNIKCPYEMEVKFITIHNTANDADAASEVAYMTKNNNEVSFHYAVDDKEIIQGLPLDRNGWHSGDGNGQGNRNSIGIEICYSKSGGTKFEQAQRNAAELTAKLLKDYNLTIDKVRTHKSWSGKNCPHRTLSDYGWDYFTNLVEGYLNPSSEVYRVRKTWADAKSQIGAYKSLDNAKAACKEGYSVFDSNGNCVYTKTAPVVENKKIDVTYQVYAGGKWYPNVVNDSDYAGVLKKSISAIYANLSSGNITYKVHTIGGKWLPEVKDRSDFAGIKGKNIDGLAMKTNTGKTIKYRVHLTNGKWLGWVNGYDVNNSNTGFAGIIGKPIDAIQIKVE